MRKVAARPRGILAAWWALVVAVAATPRESLAQERTDPMLQSAVAQAAAAVTPALVRIRVVEAGYEGGRETKSEAVGSGVIFTPEGHVITNHHVAGNAKQLLCTLATKEEMEAELVGTDPLTDIAVLKLLPPRPRDFPAARFGDSSRLRVGDYVLAMGSPLALSQSVTLGIVSNTAMVMPEMSWPARFEVEGEDVGSMVRWIGHDAEIAPGNSGGPLVNLQGEVVGINELRFGLGGAIPGNLARAVAEKLMKEGKVSRAWIGLEVQPRLRSQATGEGVLVSGTIPDSPAERAGLRAGDLLVRLAGQPVSVTVPEEIPLFNQLVAGLPVGVPVEAEVVRDGQRVVCQLIPQPREATRPRPAELPDWGITARDLSSLMALELGRESRDGAMVVGVRPGGPADEAKPRLTEGDVITEVAGKPVKNVADLAAATAALLEGKTARQPVVVGFDRKGERMLTVVKLGREKPPEPEPQVRKAWLPVVTQVLTSELAQALGLPGRRGVRVTRVYPEGAGLGLEVGDIIVSLDGEEIPAWRPDHLEVFPTMVRQRSIGAKVELGIIRGGEERRITVALRASPPTAREMKRYRSEEFEFSVRDLCLEDEVEQRLGGRRGVYVDWVAEGGWAALAHLAVGDVVLAVAGQPTPTVEAMEKVMADVAAGRPASVVLQVRRGIHERFVEIVPRWGERPNASGAAGGTTPGEKGKQG